MKKFVIVLVMLMLLVGCTPQKRSQFLEGMDIATQQMHDVNEALPVDANTAEQLEAAGKITTGVGVALDPVIPGSAAVGAVIGGIITALGIFARNKRKAKK